MPGGEAALGMLGAGMGAAGAMAGGVLDWMGTNSTNATNVKLARENRQWEQMMSNTAYQRATADMKAAGLNPALMFSHGSAADTPSPAAPTVSNALGALGRGVSSAAMAASQLGPMVMDIHRVSGEVRKLDSEARLNDLRGISSVLEQQQIRASTAKTEQERENARAQSEWISKEAQARITAAMAAAHASESSAKGNEALLNEKEFRGYTTGAVLKLLRWLDDATPGRSPPKDDSWHKNETPLPGIKGDDPGVHYRVSEPPPSSARGYSNRNWR